MALETDSVAAGRGTPSPTAWSYLAGLLGTSVMKKQLAAVSGVCLVAFIVMHLAGNLFLYGGPEAFNGYAEKLSSLGPLLWIARIGLLTVFSVHIYFTLRVTLENFRARANRYAVYAPPAHRSYATRSMYLSGIVIFLFLFLHLYDFSLTPKHGPLSVIDGEDLGLFGVVWNRFLAPGRALVYLAAMAAVGLHVAHAAQSCIQTFGIYHERVTPILRALSVAMGLLVALGFGSIPVYVWIRTYAFGS